MRRIHKIKKPLTPAGGTLFDGYKNALGVFVGIF
jgi:hypothetical protein